MQLFFILMAAITGTLLIITLLMLAAEMEIEMRKTAPARTPEWIAAKQMPAARLTISEYNRLIKAEKKRPGWVRAGSKVF